MDRTLRWFRITCIAFWMAFISGGSLYYSGQAKASGIVHDPVHMGSNLVSFLEQLKATLEESEKMAQQLKIVTNLLEVAKKVKDAAEVVSAYVQEAREIEYLARLVAANVTYLGEESKWYYDAYSKGYICDAEVRMVLNSFTTYLTHTAYVVAEATKIVYDIKGLIDNQKAGKPIMSDYERKKEIESYYRLSRNIVLTAMSKNNQMKSCVEARRRTIQLLKNPQEGTFSKVLNGMELTMCPLTLQMAGNDLPADYLRHINNFLEETNPHFDEDGEVKEDPDVVYSWQEATGEGTGTTPTPAFSWQKPKKADASDARKITNVENWAQYLFFSLSALIGLLGAFSVFKRWQMGDDVMKPMLAWFGTTIVLALIGILYPYFFHYSKTI